MKRLIDCKKTNASALILLTALMVGMFAGCRKDEPEAGSENRKGSPYKFRIELSAANPDVFDIGYGIGNYYRYFDEQLGLSRTVWFSDAEDGIYKSPFVREYEIPFNFTGFFIYGHLFAIVPEEVLRAGLISGKLFVNNKLLTEFSYHFGWSVGIVYDASKKKFVITDSRKEVKELDKLD